MKTSVKKLSETKVEIKVSVDADLLAEAKQVALGRIAKDLKVPGFRKGKVPADVAKKHADPNDVYNLTADVAINKAVARAFMDNDIRPLDGPQINVTKYVPDSDLEFTATADIFPEIKLGNYTKLKAKKDKVEVKAADVNEILKNIQNSFAVSKEVKRAAKDGDEVVIDFLGKKDGEPFDGGKAEDYALALGSGSFIPGFEEAIVGHKAGEDFDIDLKFPKDYHAKDLAGKPVVFEVKLKKVQEKELPEIDDKLAAKCGPFKSLDALKSDIKNNLIQQKENQVADKLKDELIGELVDASKVPVPEILIDDQAKQLRFDLEQNLAYRGVKMDDYLAGLGKTEEEWMKTDVAEAAKRRAETGLVLAELSRELGIDVSEEEVDERLERLKAQYQNDKAILAQIAADETRMSIKNSILTEKTVDKLVELNAGE